MRPIPAPRIGDSHGLLRAIAERERVRLDAFVTELPAEDLFPPGLENALGRMRQFVSYARAAGLLREDRGTVELTEIGRRYVRAGDPERPFDVAPGQADWLRRQMREKHMTDSIFHGLAIGLSLLGSSPGGKISTLDFGRALGYLGRAGWDNENTLQIQGERYVTLLRDLELIDERRALTATGNETKGELTLPVHMSLADLAGQLNPGGPDAVRAAAEAEWGPDGAAEPLPPAPEPLPAEIEAGVAAAGDAHEDEDDEYEDVGPGAWVAPPPPAEPAPVAPPPAPVAPPPAPVAPPPAAPAPPSILDPADADTVTSPARERVVPPEAIEAAARERGLRLDAAVYANIAAALDAGRHVLLTGPPGCGKTELALAVAKAAVDAGRADGAVLVSGHDAELREHVVGAVRRSRWVVADDLERAEPLAVLGPLLAHQPATLPGGEGELTAPASWRLLASAPRAPAGLPRGRFAVVAVPPHPDLHAAIREAAGNDPVAAEAATRLLDGAAVGAGPILAAARHALHRRRAAAAPADPAALAAELRAIYLDP